MNKKPIELHLIDGTTPKRERPTVLPQNLRKRIPKAEWMDDPDLWDRSKFLEETADFLFEAYGIGNDQDKHVLAMLADHIETYVQCTKGIRENPLVMKFNNGSTPGANPFVSIRAKETTLIIQLMNELGLTPRGRLSSGRAGDDSPMDKLMRGPKG